MPVNPSGSGRELSESARELRVQECMHEKSISMKAQQGIGSPLNRVMQNGEKRHASLQHNLANHFSTSREKRTASDYNPPVGCSRCLRISRGVCWMPHDN